MVETMSEKAIGHYLLNRLSELGVAHVFGVPGDYVLGFYDQMAHSDVAHIGTTREDTAAFAADGYARCNGLGALAVTYGVGALSVVNPIAGAYAESAPVVVISGAPGTNEIRNDPMLHHRFGPFTFQREIFERITCATAVIDDPVLAFRQIDRALAAALRHRKPVYIELPRDLVEQPGVTVAAPPDEQLETRDEAALAEAVAETAELLARSKSPVVIAGVEIHRRGLQQPLLDFIEQTNLPIAATLTGKSVIRERHPNYLGIYSGALSNDDARRVVEDSDCILMLGMTLNDIDTGGYTIQLNPQQMIRATQGEVFIRHHRYPGAPLNDFLGRLSRQAYPRNEQLPAFTTGPEATNFPEKDRAMTIARLIGRLNATLTPDMMVVCDTGDCLFAGVELRVHDQTEFLASGYYTTMGYAVPAALGAQIARPQRRALILVGDGAFQMTGTELVSHCRQGLAPIVIVFNNRGYSTERFILDGPFNDIPEWQFHRLGELFGPLAGYDAPDECAFEDALTAAVADTETASIINVRLEPRDASPAMQRLGAHLKSRLGRDDDA